MSSSNGQAVNQSNLIRVYHCVHFLTLGNMLLLHKFRNERIAQLYLFSSYISFCSFLKILELLIHGQLFSYFLQYDLFSPYQSGFRPSHSTQDVLLYVVDSWHKAIDACKFVVAGILDLAKAFDRVNHDNKLFF